MLAPVGGEAEDPLGLDVESSGGGGFPEEQLQEMFPESSGEIGSERFDPAYFLLEHHHNTTFDDLKVKIQFSSLTVCTGWVGTLASSSVRSQPEPALLHQEQHQQYNGPA